MSWTDEPLAVYEHRQEAARAVPGCRIARSDRWMPTTYPGRVFHFAVYDFGQECYTMRLFETVGQLRHFRENVEYYTKKHPQSCGTIRFKHPRCL